jgi:hypothetical protein
MSAWTTAAAALSPTLWWRLGDTSGTACADASGNSHAGTRSGSTITTGVTGPLVGDSDTAMDFAGTNPVAQVAYGSWAEPTTSPVKFTVSCWFKITGTLASGNVLVARDSQSGGRRWQLGLTSTGQVVATVIDSLNSALSVTTTATYNDGAWHFVTFAVDTSQSLASKWKLYVDNTTTPTANNGSANAPNSSGTTVAFSVGNATRTTQSPANASIDEVLYFVNTTLTGAQHQALWSAGVYVAPPGDPTSVSGTWLSGTSADVSWAAPSGGGPVSEYEVRINGGAAVGPASSPHTFTGLTPGTTYTLEVRAKGTGGASAWVSASVTTPALPNPPTALTLGAVTYTTAELSWSAPSGGGPVTSYEVRVDSGSASAATSPHTFTGLASGTSYSLEARTVGPGGVSSWATLAADTVAAPPGYYRVELDVGPLSWDIELGETPDYGPRLPVALGWSMPDQVEFFPCQPDQTTLSFQLYVANAHDVAAIVKGSTVTFAMYVTPDAGADPWQSFTGVVVQLDGESVLPNGGFLVTVYCVDDTARLSGLVIGYTSDWPQENVYDRVNRICTEAGLTFVGAYLGTGLEGTLAARPKAPVDVLSAVRASLKDAADEDTSTLAGHSYYGRHVIGYDPATSELTLYGLYRRVPGEWQTPPDPQQLELDGSYVDATGSWSKLPGPDGATWVIVDGGTFGTPSGPPLVRSTAYVDTSPSNPSATARDTLGESLLPDGSTYLSGWYARTLRYEAHEAPDPVGPYMGLTGAPGLASWAPLTVCIPVVVVDVLPKYDLEDLGYLAGTLTGARMVIPTDGRFYVELRLRPELLPGMALP